MNQLFQLTKKEYSEIYQEEQWTYQLLFSFTFNFRTITKITITDHIWKKKDREWITPELILDIFRTNLNGTNREPSKKHGNREVFVEEEVPYSDKNYCLIFWFENSNPDWLWVRNCYPLS